MNFFQGILRSGNFRTDRLDAFSDGVFAIVITLLVLELHIPQIQGESVLKDLMASLIPLALNFLVLF